MVSMRARAIGPVDPASPYPTRPASVMMRMRQLPVCVVSAMASMAVIFVLPRYGAASAS